MGNVTHLQGDPKNKDLHLEQKDGSTDLSLPVRNTEKADDYRSKIFLMAHACLQGFIYKGMIIATQVCTIDKNIM